MPPPIKKLTPTQRRRLAAWQQRLERAEKKRAEEIAKATAKRDEVRLAYADFVRSEAGISAVAREFGISMKAMDMRIANLERRRRGR